MQAFSAGGHGLHVFYLKSLNRGRTLSRPVFRESGIFKGQGGTARLPADGGGPGGIPEAPGRDLKPVRGCQSVWPAARFGPFLEKRPDGIQGWLDWQDSCFIAAGRKAGPDLMILPGAVAGGDMFGDSLIMISDTAIAAALGQGVEMKDKFRLNLLVALPAALVPLVLLGVFGVISVSMAYAGGACLSALWNREYDCPASRAEERNAMLSAEHAG